MARVQRTFTVDKPADLVVSYLKDFSHAERWDPGTLTCTRLDSGPLGEGSAWHNVSKFLGRKVELTYRLEQDSPHRLTFVGTNDAATSTDDMTFELVGTATRITYTANIQLRGSARLADPLVNLALRALGGQVITRMREAMSEL